MSDSALADAPAAGSPVGGSAADLVASARAHAAAGRKREAADDFDAAAGLDPSDVPLHMSAGGAAFAAGRHARAIELFERVVRLTPAHGRALINIGAVHNAAGKHRDAERALSKGIALDTACAEGFYNLGIARRKLGKKRLAADAYREAVRLDPGFAEAHQNLGNTLIDLGRYKAAADAFRTALRVRPDFAKAAAGLRTAEAKATERNPAFSAFGRLAGAPPKAAGAAREEDYPPLTEARRAKDRKKLRALARSLEEATTEYAAALKGDLTAELTRLEHVILGSTGARLADAADGLGDAVSRLAVKERPARRVMLRLRAHEELIRAPSLPVEDGASKLSPEAAAPVPPPHVPGETGSSAEAMVVTDA